MIALWKNEVRQCILSMENIVEQLCSPILIPENLFTIISFCLLKKLAIHQYKICNPKMKKDRGTLLEIQTVRKFALYCRKFYNSSIEMENNFKYWRCLDFSNGSYLDGVIKTDFGKKLVIGQKKKQYLSFFPLYLLPQYPC